MSKSSSSRRSASDVETSVVPQELSAEYLVSNAFNAMSMFSSQGGNEPTATAEATSFSTRARGLFPTIDADNNGFLSSAEIDAAVVNRDIRGDDAAVVAVLNQLASDLEELANDEFGDENDGVTLADLEAYERTRSVSGSLKERAESWFAYSKGRIGASTHTLYGPTGVPEVGAIQQGSLGDCFFLAAIGSLVARDPAAIQRMITDNGDGTFTVSFPGQTAVTVNGPTDAEIAQYATSGGNGFWLTVLENAYGEIQSPNQAIPNEGADTLIGGSLASGIEFLTGHSVNTDMLGLSATSTIKARLTDAFTNGRIVTASIRKAMPFTSGETASGLPMGHAYSVTAWDAATETLTIRNPWGRGETKNADGTPVDGRDDGTFTMGLADFMSTFTMVSYEEAP